jgi:predicted nicotinamide N-methyase
VTTSSPAGHDRAAADFILARTRLVSPPCVPEVRLHLAGEPFQLWRETERRYGPALPFWAFAWAGGQALARYVLDHPGVVAGRRVLDLGSGGGLVAIAAALAGAAAVVASEVDPLATVAIDLNARANQVALAGVIGDVFDADPVDADLVLAGDVFYERAMGERAARCLERARSRGTTVLVGDPGRAYLPRDRFEPVATYDVPASGPLEGADVTPATVWRARDG